MTLIYSAVPTLFAGSGELDLAANKSLYTFLAGLTDGVFVAGTTGEFPALEDSERLSLIDAALGVAGPERVIAHIGGVGARQAARLARDAVALGALRIAAITPYYLPARPDELASVYAQIRDAAPAAEFYGYIFPERTSVPVPPTLLAELAENAGLAGAKLSGSAAAMLPEYVLAAPGLRFFSGDDSDPGRFAAAGAAGVISGRSAAYPEVFAALSSDTESAGALEARTALDRIVALGSSIGRIKHAIALRGFGSALARMTVDPPDAATAAAIADVVADLPPVNLNG